MRMRKQVERLGAVIINEDVTRVDFFSVGHFVEMLAILSGGGKKISIRNANEMVRALFSVMEVDKYSTILRRRIA